MLHFVAQMKGATWLSLSGITALLWRVKAMTLVK